MSSSSDALAPLLRNNKQWREAVKKDDATFFDRLAVKQTPAYLWIGCSDSRVPAELLLGLKPGEVFVHRNIANVVAATDLSVLSVIHYAVEHLHVRDILVCGHYGCGGCQAALQASDHGLLDNWLVNIRTVRDKHQAEFAGLDAAATFDRLIELNAVEQALNVLKINAVQQHQATYGYPRVHAVTFSLKTGELKEMPVDLDAELAKSRGVFRLHQFPEGLPRDRRQIQSNMLHTLLDGHQEDEAAHLVSAQYITRAMQKEADVFTPEEVADAMDLAMKERKDAHSPFVPIEALVKYFAPTGAASAPTPVWLTK